MKENKHIKTAVHPRNSHRDRYDFPSLISSRPELAEFVAENKYGDLSIDFADPKAVRELNRALLKNFYKIAEWDIPDGYLCPPIPGRADYLHYVADLLANSNDGKRQSGEQIKVLDIGVGANCIYPMLGNSIYNWSFIGSEIDEVALDAAQNNLYANPQFRGKITLRLQENPREILAGIIKSDDIFDVVICNPPFHESQAAAEEASTRKVKNLKGKVIKKVTLNFGGQSNELWCEGGESAFIQKMIRESMTFKYNCFWFTTIVSKEEHVKELILALKKARVSDRKIYDMTLGNKKSRFIAWTFQNPEQQENWRNRRWK
ncbi:23S rRNA (adenine1618-N6)-methyltransferase [Algoriphagus ratkowskyi]|uniref:Ribosomal RNA large subunit methyltransferase F n=1 Tax=Algoriphagus ratkowskyi TaxID=57028 RepID=A0A2W7RV11_9BACT|nr:23S rRNA (adenine(1618)-N(6))-methyltransferase RlmF [Algoriphagus ratkowskyi]PZX58479.1 23S rRNA (adenine1618-N6)-methyltransferase [Algoriphagus ratkowskyi]TXD77658.1 23S rRNA (adenine(1618)-N(6))-methyltransferase RlmF [Algoriphagus ratkowskyi]